MKEKVIELIIFWVTGVYEEEKYTKDACIEVANLLLRLLEVENEVEENLINVFPKNNPIYVIYKQLQENPKDKIKQAIINAKESIEKYNFDENILKNIEVENDVKELSKKISGV